MELQGVDSNGKLVKARFDEFAKDNTGESEVFAGVGSTPAHARYRNTKTNEIREADLRLLAEQGGLSKVRFKFDPEMAKEMGFINKNSVDTGMAYVVERIRSDNGKNQYLKDKGYVNIFNDGDDFYQAKDGYITPINNVDGIDRSDFMRIAAHAGRDVGAASAAIATGIGSAATGGAALLGIGAATAAGAAGGEMVQRGVDKLIGSDADKYNSRMDLGDEALGVAKDAAVGAVTGIVGQGATAVGYKALAAGSKAASGIAEKAGVEAASKWFGDYAAKKEAGYVAASMPGGWLNSAKTAEEAKAIEIMKDTMQPGKTIEAVKEGTKLAQGELALGRAKESGNQAAAQSAEFSQNTLRELFKQNEEARMLEQSKNIMEKNVFDAGRAQRVSAYREDAREKVKEVFGGKYGKEVDEILSPETSKAVADRHVAQIEKEFFTDIKNSTGVKIGYEKSTGGFDVNEASLIDWTSKMINDKADKVGMNADHYAQAGLKFAKVPSDQEKGTLLSLLDKAAETVRTAGSDIGSKASVDTASVIENLSKVISKQSPVNTDDTTFAIRQFMKQAREVAGDGSIPPSVHSAMKNVSNLVFGYAESGSANLRALDAAYTLHNKAIDSKELLRDAIYSDKGGINFVVGHFDDLCRTAGDYNGVESSAIAKMWYLKSKVDGNVDKEAFNLMNDVDRMQVGSLEALQKHADWVPRMTEAEANGGLVRNIATKAVAGTVGVIAAKISPAMAPAAYHATEETLKEVTKNGILKTAKDVTVKAAASAKNAAQTPVAKRTAKYYGIETGADWVKDKLQNYTSSSDNER